MEAYQNYQLKDLEIGDIQPQGWLADQLMLQLKGITGDLDENWGSVGSYADWIGGTDNSWERPPYWLDGLVPLDPGFSERKRRFRPQLPDGGL